VLVRLKVGISFNADTLSANKLLGPGDVFDDPYRGIRVEVLYTNPSLNSGQATVKISTY